MRSTTAGEITTLDSTSRRETLRVKVANGSGTMIDLTSWVESYSIDHDVDQPVSGATIAFTRANGTTQSLAPLRTDSTLNVDDAAAYAPIIDLNRAITIEVATTDIGAAIVAGDYKMMFDGTIDIVDWAATPIVATCRDGMAALVDRWVEDTAYYGSSPVGTNLEVVMEDIADDVFGAGVEPVFTPISPAYAVNKYQQQEMSVMDAWTDLVQLRGMDIREKWDDGTSAFRHTLYEPDRAKVIPDHTFIPSKYFTISQLTLELTNIRNVVQVTFKDSANLGNRNKVTVTDGPSITKYGRRFFRMQEADTSPIDTSAEATTMANAAVADLKDPKAEQEVEMPFFWPAELGDLYRYPDNRVHYNTNQDWAVVEIKHTFVGGENPRHRTIIKTRGSPIGQYATWYGRGGSGGGPSSGGGSAFAPYPFITPLGTEASDLTWDLRFNALNGSGGGGTNLTYTIYLKEGVGAPTLLNSGNASAFPKDLTVVRDPKQSGVLTFRVTDAATGLFAEATYGIPAANTFLNNVGLVIGTEIEANTVGPGQTNSRFRTKLSDTASQSIATSTGTNLTFNTELWDNGSLHSTVSNTDRIVVPAGGDIGNWYLAGIVPFDANATGRREARIWHMPVGGGPGSLVAETVVAGLSDAGVGPTLNISGVAQPPAVGDYFVLEGWQNSGGALNVTSSRRFSATHIW